MARPYAEIVGDLLAEAVSKGYVTPDKVTSASEVHIRTGVPATSFTWSRSGY